MFKLSSSLEEITSRKVTVLLLFSILVILLRLPSFFYSTLSWDESLYLLIADKMIEGYPPYSIVWDNKPPGIYLLFAIGLSIFGHSVSSIRVLACIFATLTCFVLFLTGSLIRENGKLIGLVAGVLYAVSSAALHEGMSANAETFITLFAATAFYLLVREKINHEKFNNQNTWLLFGTGLILGIGFEIKFVVLFDLLPFLLILGTSILNQTGSRNKYFTLVQSFIFMGAGFLTPFILASFYFLSIGEFDSYYYANFTANKLRTQGNSFSFKHLFDTIFRILLPRNPIMWLCVPIAIGSLFLHKKMDSKERWAISTAVVWLSIVLFTMVTFFSEHLYDHYFLQLYPALSLISGYVITRLFTPGFGLVRNLSLRRRHLGVVLILLILILILGKEPLLLGGKHIYFRCVRGIRNWLDTPAAIADYISPRITSDDYIYVADYQPIIYYLTKARLPSKYSYPPFLVIRKDLPNITGVNPYEELDRIFEKQPIYVIRNQEGSYEEAFYAPETKFFLERLNRYLDKSYFLERTFSEIGKNIELFRLKQQ